MLYRTTIALILCAFAGCGDDDAECPDGFVRTGERLCLPAMDGGSSNDASADGAAADTAGDAMSMSGEACDGEDNDGDDRVDEELNEPCSTEVGICTAGIRSCVNGEMTECDGVEPADERCDGLEDEDCDGSVDEGCTCAAGTSRACGTDEGRCVQGMQDCVGGAFGECIGGVEPVEELCNDEDDDCDGMVDEGNPEGGAACGMDRGACTVGEITCADGVLACSGVLPMEIETACDGEDEDCDGVVDEGQLTMFYPDMDGDGQGDAMAMPMLACTAPPNTVADNRDCNDDCMTCFVGGTEMCNGLDNDCNGVVDNQLRQTFYRDSDGDGFGDPEDSMQACSQPNGYVSDNTDCGPQDADARPNQGNFFDHAIMGARRNGVQPYDYNCDSNQQLEAGFMVNCGSFSCSSGWSGAVPACGDSGNFVFCLRVAMMCGAGPATPDTQRCR